MNGKNGFSSWSARGKNYFRLETATAVTIAVLPGEVRMASPMFAVHHLATVEVYAVKAGMETFLGYAEGEQKRRLLTCFKGMC